MAGSQPPSASPAPGFYGREVDLAVLDDALESAVSGRPAVVLIGGDAGMGKTRLISEFASRLPERVLWGGCLPMGERGVPYVPFNQMFHALDEAERDLMPDALELIAPRGGEAEMVPSRPHLFHAVIEFF